MTSPTQAQYDAAAKAMADLANQMIGSLPFFEQGAAQEFVTSDLLAQFAKVGLDAAFAIPTGS